MSKPSLIVLTLVIFIFLNQIQICGATEQENRTLVEVSNYHFEEGYYNVVKYAENSVSDYWIMHESELPYLNITYKASSIGQLEITLNPTEGIVPYIELSEGWETDGLTYINPMLINETSYILLTPALKFSDSNVSRITGGAITLWEMYKWTNTSGKITYTFITPDDITFEILMHPTSPKKGDSINFFTTSNAELFDVTWFFPELDWVNQSEVIEIKDLEPGNYTVFVTSLDAFNITHTAQTRFTLLPNTLQTQSFDLDLFSVSYPETISHGDQIEISTTIDYSMPFPAIIKCTLFDPVNKVECKALTYNVTDSGSEFFSHQLMADEYGVKSFVLKLYYDVGAGWVEVSEAETSLSITINKAQSVTSIPGYQPKMIIAGITLLIMLYKNQNNY